MRGQIDELLAILADARHRITELIAQTDRYQDDRYGSLIGARVDLHAAGNQINRAEIYIQRLIVNGTKPWDEVTL